MLLCEIKELSGKSAGFAEEAGSSGLYEIVSLFPVKKPVLSLIWVICSLCN